MNPDTGAIRPLPEAELPAPREIPISEVEAKVLERYDARYRPELLRRWRAGTLALRVTPEGPRLEDVAGPKRQLRKAEAGWTSKKARRRLAAASKRRNRQR